MSTPEYASCGWRRQLTWLTTDHGYFNVIAVLSSLFQTGFREAVLIPNYAEKR